MKMPTLYGLLQVRGFMEEQGFSLPLIKMDCYENERQQLYLNANESIAFDTIEAELEKNVSNKKVNNVMLVDRPGENRLSFVNPECIAIKNTDPLLCFKSSESWMNFTGTEAFQKFVVIHQETLEKMAQKKECGISAFFRDIGKRLHTV